MPFLYYWPMIVWTGLFGLACDPAPAPVKVKARR